MFHRCACALMLLLTVSSLAACGSGNANTSSQAAAPAPASTTTSTTTTASATSSAPAASAAPGPEGIPLEAGPVLAPASSTTQGSPVDGIKCAPTEQLVYHIHSHLQVYVNGKPRQLPGAIGLIDPVGQQTAYGAFYGARGCIYWLHTHAGDGIIHVESPSVRVYTLGNFFDEWRQPLSRRQVAGANGKVTAFVNGRLWRRDPRAIPLLPHASIDLDVGAPAVHPTLVSWAGLSL